MTTIEQVYLAACGRYGRVPNDDQAEAWRDVLGYYEAREVMDAVTTWQGRTDPANDGTPTGRFFPSPADLKIILQRSERDRQDGMQFKACGRCEAGWVRFQVSLGEKTREKVKRCRCWLAYAEAKRAASPATRGAA